MTRPLVGVPAYPRLPRGRVRGWSDDGVGLPARYVDALHRAGGREALFLPEAWSADDAAAFLARVDGLLLVGGGDLDPATYGEETRAAVYGVDAARDACELTLVGAALEVGVPMLAICRGHQVLAVALGGGLDQDIAGNPALLDHGAPGVEGGARPHPVEVTAGSRLARTLGATATTVSSHHHQAVTRLGPSTRVVARATDGVIEGIELATPDAPWVLGVQWHPEDTAAADPLQQRLFDGFVAECMPRGTPRALGARRGGEDVQPRGRVLELVRRALDDLDDREPAPGQGRHELARGEQRRVDRHRLPEELVGVQVPDAGVDGHQQDPAGSQRAVQLTPGAWHAAAGQVDEGVQGDDPGQPVVGHVEGGQVTDREPQPRVASRTRPRSSRG